MQKHNTAAREPADVLGTDLPKTVSSAYFQRPYLYAVVRVDDGRAKRLDDHEEGRELRTYPTRHNAVGYKARLDRVGVGEYTIIPRENPGYEPSR